MNSRGKKLSCFVALSLVLAALFTPVLGQQQPLLENYQEGRQQGVLQSYQISANSFVSGPNGTVYVVLNEELFRCVSDQADAWEKLAGGVRRVAADPQNEKGLYVITTQNRINKSLDEGKTWIELSTGLPNSPIWTVYVNPTNDQEVFLGTLGGLLKTNDAGFTWHTTSFTQVVSEVLVDHRSPANQFLVSAGSIFVSSDAGNSWKKSETGLPVQLNRGAGRTASKVPVPVSFLLSAQWQKPFLLAVTVEKGVFRSDDNGSSWKPAGTGLDTSAQFLSAFAGGDRVVLASPDTLYNSTDGMTWKRLLINSGRNIAGSVLGVIGHPNRDGLLLNFRFSQDTGNRRRLGYLDRNGILIGLNYGVTPHSDVDSVWLAERDGRPVIFAATANVTDVEQNERNTRPTFISASENGGYSWELVLDTHCGEQGATRPGNMSEIWVYGTCVQHTDDGGLHWILFPGIQAPWGGYEPITKIEPDPMDRKLFYYCSGVNERLLYRYKYDHSAGQGQSVDLKTLGADVMVAEDNNKMIFTGTGKLSADGGWTWADKSKAISKLKIEVYTSGYVWPFRLLSFRNGEIRAVYSQTNQWTGDHVVRILRSRDSGDTWDEVSSLPNHAVIGIEPLLMEMPTERRMMLFFNPKDPSNAYVATLAYSKRQSFSGLSGTEVLETKDRGDTWHQIYFRGPVEIPHRNALAEMVRGVCQFPTAAGRALFVGGSRGLWRSDDEGQTWKQLGGVQ